MLQVLSAPQGQLTLSPKVQSAPVQPTLAPRVITQPKQPTLAPRVVTQPAQPSFNPQVQQPNQQASLPIHYAPIIMAITQAQQRGATPDLILQKIIEGNPDKTALVEALNRGA